ncbi:uncharacterized protein PG998_013975 [Apiospora kogelbergensis]|uniref:uncharacterized protein n=1 Tax=Apiospora kogelbergensis TaxID=1337665 RepID=UPI00312E45B8
MNAPIGSPSAQRPSAMLPGASPPPTKQASTDIFIRDLNLVAEAAKRAQMACLMRDMESIGIS